MTCRICINTSFLAFLLLTPALTLAEVKLIGEDKQAALELWDTLLGRLWIPAPGRFVIKHLEWEQAVEKVYDHPSVHVNNGDIVIDCGAHIGGFTRTALLAGAKLVVAVEPARSPVLSARRLANSNRPTAGRFFSMKSPPPALECK